jgi:hypothetical protein
MGQHFSPALAKALHPLEQESKKRKQKKTL